MDCLKIEKRFIDCPVCGKDNYAVLYEPWVDVDDPAELYGAASGIPGTQYLVKCQCCEMIYENPVYPAEVIIEGYRQSEQGPHDSQFPMRVESFYKALKRSASRIPLEGSRVLDIGTAGGAFLVAAERYGYESWGMEPSADLVERGKARGLKIEQGTIEQNNFEESSFDMICLWDVIEHLPDPKGALNRIALLLKPDGVLLINYPDIGTWMGKLFGRRFWWILSVHLHHFTRTTISRLLETTRYEPISFGRYYQILQIGYLEDVAIQLDIPLSGLLKRLTPGFLQRLPIPYYASQTTALARVRK